MSVARKVIGAAIAAALLVGTVGCAAATSTGTEKPQTNAVPVALAADSQWSRPPQKALYGIGPLNTNGAGVPDAESV